MKHLLLLIAFGNCLLWATCTPSRAKSNQLGKEIRICGEVPSAPKEEMDKVAKVQVTCSPKDWTKLFTDLTTFSNLNEIEFLRLTPYLPDHNPSPEKLTTYYWNDCDSIGTIAHDAFYEKVRNVQISGTPGGTQAFLSKLSNAPNLQSLSLRSAKLQETPKSLLSLKLLKRLDLSHNELKNLPPEFQHLHHLEYLHLNGNQIQQIPPILKRLPRLKWVDFSDNPIILSDSDRVWIKSLQQRQ